MTRPAVFLDRDGTLVEDVPYLHDPERSTAACGGCWPGPGMLEAAASARCVAAFDGLAATVGAVVVGRTPTGREEARPAPAVTVRAWPGMPVGRERARR